MPPRLGLARRRRGGRDGARSLPDWRSSAAEPAAPAWVFGGVPNHATTRAADHAAILQMQRTLGNRAVQGYLRQQRPAVSGGTVGRAVVQRGWFDDEEETGAEEGGSVTDWISDTAGSAAEWVEDAGGEAVDWAAEQAGTAADWVGEQAAAAAGWAGEQVGGAVAWIEEQAGAADQPWAENSGGPSADPVEDEPETVEDEPETVDEFRLRLLAARPRDAHGAWGRLDQRERFAVFLYVGQIYGADFAQRFMAAVSSPDFGTEVDTPANVSAQQLQAHGYRVMRDGGDYTIWVLPTGREYWIQNQAAPEDDPAVKEAREHCQALTAGKGNLERLLLMAEERLGSDDYPLLYRSLAAEVGRFATSLNDKAKRFVDLRQQVSPRAHAALDAQERCLLEIERWKNTQFFPRYGRLPVVPAEPRDATE